MKAESASFKKISPIFHVYTMFIYGPRREKTCLGGFASNTGADQPVHPRSLISAFVIRSLKIIICKSATGGDNLCS